MIWILDRQKEPIVAAKRVLRSEEFLTVRGFKELIASAEERAVAIVAAATQRAKEIVATANAEAKKIVGSADAAREEEKKRGYGDGLVEGKKEMAVRMAELAKKEMANFVAFEESVQNIVMRSIRRIVGELGDDERMRKLVRNALSVVRNQKKIILKVHPDDAAAARKGVSDATVADGDGEVRFVEVIADGRLEKNSCIMETEIGTIDASLDTLLAAIRNLVVETFSDE
jgi:type III secretion protein L